MGSRQAPEEPEACRLLRTAAHSETAGFYEGRFSKAFSMLAAVAAETGANGGRKRGEQRPRRDSAYFGPAGFGSRASAVASGCSTSFSRRASAKSVTLTAFTSRAHRRGATV